MFEAEQTAERLGYQNTWNAVNRHVEPTHLLKRGMSKEIRDGSRVSMQMRQVWFVTEAGLYDLILGSKNPYSPKNPPNLP